MTKGHGNEIVDRLATLSPFLLCVRDLLMLLRTCNKSLSRQKREKDKKRKRLVILGMLINIHELLSLASIFKMTGLLSTVSLKLE